MTNDATRVRATSKSREVNTAEPSEVAIAIGLTIYARMVRLAHDNNQVVGEQSRYYVTLEQLEQAFINLRDEVKL